MEVLFKYIFILEGTGVTASLQERVYSLFGYKVGPGGGSIQRGI